MFLFRDSKCKRLFHNRLKPSKLYWTALYRKQHKKVRARLTHDRFCRLVDLSAFRDFFFFPSDPLVSAVHSMNISQLLLGDKVTRDSVGTVQHSPAWVHEKQVQ